MKYVKLYFLERKIGKTIINMNKKKCQESGNGYRYRPQKNTQKGLLSHICRQRRPRSVIRTFAASILTLNSYHVMDKISR